MIKQNRKQTTARANGACGPYPKLSANIFAITPATIAKNPFANVVVAKVFYIAFKG